MLFIVCCRRTRRRAEESDAAREKFFVPESDHLTLLHVYQQWKANGYRGDWCSQHFLQVRGRGGEGSGLHSLSFSVELFHFPPARAGPLPCPCPPAPCPCLCFHTTPTLQAKGLRKLPRLLISHADSLCCCFRTTCTQPSHTHTHNPPRRRPRA